MKWFRALREKRDKRTDTEVREFLQKSSKHVSREWMRSYLFVYGLNIGLETPIEAIDEALDEVYGNRP